MKKLLAALLTLSMLLALAACGTTPAVTTDAPETTNAPETTEAPVTTEAPAPDPVAMSVVALKGPTGMGLAKLMDASAADDTANDYTFTLAGDPTEVSASVIKGEVDVACVPVNLASTLYNKTEGKYICLAINTLGVLHILEIGDSVKSVADLAGKTLHATGQGSTPEYILNYILEKNGIADKVTVEYQTEHTALVSLFASGAVTLGMLPEPNVSAAMVQTPGLRQALDLTAEWDKVCDTSAVQGCVIVKKEFAEKNPEALVAFMDEYAASVKFVNENVEEAATLCQTYGIVPKAAIAKRALPNCNIVFVTGSEMKTDLSAFLKVLFDANPKSVGGKLPGDDFYYGAN
ncbi:MAG: ABC transporter substrate-binding protein [Clostridia bacterium]|nr:ABC transporter substrate-binding protein [Clostridia bacterium]